MKVYIQSDRYHHLPHHFDCACAMYGAIESCMDYKLIQYDNLASGKYDLLLKDNLFVGSVEFMTEVFRRQGKAPKLPKNSNRESILSTVGEVIKMNRMEKRFNIFIKPVEQKLFTGFVMEGFSYPILDTLPPETPVLIYEVFDQYLIAEHRLYISYHKCIDIRHYSGAIDTLPFKDYYEAVIADNKCNFPNNYIMDIGILEGGANVVVEFNDCYAIGNYGIPNDLYLKMLKERYFEIIKA